jgi:hypothetical protein
MNNLQQQIDELKGKTFELEKQLQEENKNKLLPFLQKFATCEYSLSGRVALIFNDDNKKEEFIKLLHSSYDSPFIDRYFCIKIIENVSVIFDNNTPHLSFEFSGLTKELPGKILNAAKKLKLNVDFSSALEHKQKEIQRITAAYEELVKLKEDFEKNKL